MDPDFCSLKVFGGKGLEKAFLWPGCGVCKCMLKCVPQKDTKCPSPDCSSRDRINNVKTSSQTSVGFSVS